MVSGVVTDGSNPVAGATVAVAGLDNITTTSDASGVYTLTYVPDGTFTLFAVKCGYTLASQTITVTYPESAHAEPDVGRAYGAAWRRLRVGQPQQLGGDRRQHQHRYLERINVRAMSGTYAARAGIPGQPLYTGAADTYMTSAVFDASAGDQVWLSFNLYDSAESEYDILRTQVSSDGGTTWVTVQGQASPVHGWQAICLDLTPWKSATMKIRFYFHSDSSNWNGETFEGPSIDDVSFSYTPPTGTSIPAQTPTPGTPLPCGNCSLTFTDVISGSTFYPYIQCMACQGIINGYPCGGPGEPCNGE